MSVWELKKKWFGMLRMGFKLGTYKLIAWLASQCDEPVFLFNKVAVFVQQGGFTQMMRPREGGLDALPEVRGG
jgi:hypothetical protein